MSDKHLQPLTERLSYIGQQATRRALPSRRRHVTQKVRIAAEQTLYISVYDDERPAEIFLRLKVPDCSSEVIGLYDVIARLMSLALQAPVSGLLAGAKFQPCGPVSGHTRLKHGASLPDIMGRYLLLSTEGGRKWPTAQGSSAKSKKTNNV